MSCIKNCCKGNCFEKCEKAYNEKIKSKEKDFEDVKNGVEIYTGKINHSLHNFNDWDELLNLKGKTKEIETLKELKTIKKSCKDNKILLAFIGFIFCLVHLIGIQAYIILNNSLYSEIVEDIKLSCMDSRRQYYFFEYLEINTYRKLPEINVVMMASSIGTLILNKCGFKITNSIFQLISLYLFGLLFYLFEFKKSNQFLEKYSKLELTILIISYIVLSLSVGISSLLALKEYFNKLTGVFYKDKICGDLCGYDIEEYIEEYKEIKNENEENIDENKENKKEEDIVKEKEKVESSISKEDNKGEEVKETNESDNLNNKEKTEELANNNNINNNNEEEIQQNDTKEEKGETKNENDKEEETNQNEEKEEQKEEQKNEEKEEDEDEDILSSIDKLIQLNNKIQNDTFDVIKRSEEEIHEKIVPESFINILKLNNRRILGYKLFCLYTNYNESTSFCTKKKLPKKFYFNYWHKSLNIKNDE